MLNIRFSRLVAAVGSRCVVCRNNQTPLQEFYTIKCCIWRTSTSAQGYSQCDINVCLSVLRMLQNASAYRCVCCVCCAVLVRLLASLLFMLLYVFHTQWMYTVQCTAVQHSTEQNRTEQHRTSTLPHFTGIVCAKNAVCAFKICFCIYIHIIHICMNRVNDEWAF